MTGKTGTMRYMAPEVVKSEPHYNEKVDIYSMAMIIWFICHGVRPFEGVQPELVADLTSSRGMRPSLEGLNWPEMADIISLMWADSPAARPDSRTILENLNRMCVDDFPALAERDVSCSTRCSCLIM